SVKERPPAPGRRSPIAPPPGPRDRTRTTRTTRPSDDEVRGTLMSPITRRSRRATAALSATGALARVLTACSSGSGGGSADGAESAVEEGGTITVWAWDPTLESVAADFEEANPGVEVDIVNAGTGNDQYTALQNAIAAGSGVPDVAQIEFY